MARSPDRVQALRSLAFRSAVGVLLGRILGVPLRQSAGQEQ
jgi:hypothetical protein